MRTRWFLLSAMNTWPRPSTATPRGWSSSADTAGPPSPAGPEVPVPAMVVTTPAGSIRRTR